MGLLEKNVSPSLRFFLPKDLFGGNLLLSEATLVRVVLEETSPPFLTSCCPEAFYEKEVFGIPMDDLFANEATRENFVFFEKNVSPLSCALLSSKSFVLFVAGQIL